MYLLKFVHFADLHIGKRLHEISLLDDQRHALHDMLEHTRIIRPDVAFIAGDVYDKPVPSHEAVQLLEDFILALGEMVPRIMIVGGNHDDQQRLSFLAPLLAAQNVTIAGPYMGAIEKVTVPDRHGEVDVWLLPHVTPGRVGHLLGEPIGSSEEAVRAILGREQIDHRRRNVLVAHQFVTSGGERTIRSDSEVHLIGGLDEVDASAFDRFCYVALGHLHGAQRVGRDAVRYAGSPVRYSFSEIHQHKTFVSGEIDAHGQVTTELVAISQLHGMRAVRGLLDEVMALPGDRSDYLRVTLTDARPGLMAAERLATRYDGVLMLEFERDHGAAGELPAPALLTQDPIEQFADFFSHVTGRDMQADERAYILDVLAETQAGGGAHEAG